MDVGWLLPGVIGVVIGGLAAMLLARQRYVPALAQWEKRLAVAEAERAAEARAAAERLEVMARARADSEQAFQALSAAALQANNRSFLDLATETLSRFQTGAKAELDSKQQAIDALLVPLKEALGKVDGRIGELEQVRAAAYAGLREQVGQLMEAQGALRSETQSLARALRVPNVRGRWGELHLRRVVELAGLVGRVDFFEQISIAAEDATLRPDMVVHLPGGGIVVIDAKVPLADFLSAHEASDDATRHAHLGRHAEHVRAHLRGLGRKAYWQQFARTPEFVVLFLPGEAMFGAALELAPDLIEEGARSNVVVATPTTLIALLRAVAYGWRQETLAESARAISAAGQELYKRLSDFGGHMGKVGQELRQAVDAYNRAVGSLESRVLPSARRLKELGAAPESASLEALPAIADGPRHLAAPELLERAAE